MCGAAVFGYKAAIGRSLDPLQLQPAARAAKHGEVSHTLLGVQHKQRARTTRPAPGQRQLMARNERER
jgi:hypothetical protein